VHPSVDMFLLTDDSATRPESFYTPMDAAQTLMTSTIATYLSYGVFGTEVSTRLPALEVGPVPHDIIKSVTSTTRGVQNIALKLLKSRKQSDFDASNSIAGFRTQTPPEVQDFHFYDYAKMHALQHVAASFRLSRDIVIALYQLLDRGMIQINTIEDVYAQLCLALLRASNERDITAQFRHITRGMSASLDSYRLFYFAFEKGRGDVVKYQLEAHRGLIETYVRSSGGYPDEVRYHLVGSALICHATKEHQNSIVSILIDSGMIDINARSHPLEMPIGVAVMEQNFDAFIILLSKCDEVFVSYMKIALAPYIATNDTLSTKAISTLERYGFSGIAASRSPSPTTSEVSLDWS
jgi:hypothetical protein